MTWLGDSYYIVTTGYSKQSNREVVLRDIRNINSVIYTITADNVWPSIESSVESRTLRPLLQPHLSRSVVLGKRGCEAQRHRRRRHDNVDESRQDLELEVICRRRELHRYQSQEFREESRHDAAASSRYVTK